MLILHVNQQCQTDLKDCDSMIVIFKDVLFSRCLKVLTTSSLIHGSVFINTLIITCNQNLYTVSAKCHNMLHYYYFISQSQYSTLNH